MIVPFLGRQGFDFLGTPSVLGQSAVKLSSDTGPLPARQFAEHIGHALGANACA